MNIDEMQAGTELDALVAERVLGWHVWSQKVESWHVHPHWFYDDGERKDDLPDFSTDIAAAWLVVERITKALDQFITNDGIEHYGYWTLDRLGFDCCRDGEPDVDGVHGEWRCHFSRNKSDSERDDLFTTAPTAPLAICRAALKAVQVTA